MSGTLVFNPAIYQAAAINQRQLTTTMTGVNTSVLCDGTTIDTDSDGRVLQAVYASGTKVKRNPNYCMVQSKDLGYWIGDKHGRWFPLD
ncbi:MAG TPA: hypothetical protein V6C89_03690 [Drouetiella sp.]|jgi:hypothetical protein